MKQEIYLIGLNHRTAGVQVRERYALTDKNPFVDAEGRSLLDQADRHGHPAIRETLVLSTCNRVEIIAVGANGTGVPERVIRRWAACCGGEWTELSKHVYVHAGLDAVRHVFTVAASLDSMVLGEPQILGQMKQAYKKSVERGSAKVIINRLMHKTFSAAKRVRSETGIASSAVSISYAAVELAKRIFGDIIGKKAMLIGAGEMAELAATHLLNSGVTEIVIANRTFARAEELASRFKGRAVVFDELAAALEDVDIIISSTGAPQVIIRAKDIKQVIRKRKNRPMFFIDIAVPRDIDPDVNSLDNVYLYDIDDLKEVVEENQAQRREEAVKAKGIVESEVGSFDRWLRSLDLQPTIVDLLHHGEGLARRELAKTMRRLGPDVSEETRQAVEWLALSIGRKVFHEPITFLKRRSLEEDAGRRYIDYTRRLYNLDGDHPPHDAHLDRKSLQDPTADIPDPVEEICREDDTKE